MALNYKIPTEDLPGEITMCGSGLFYRVVTAPYPNNVPGRVKESSCTSISPAIYATGGPDEQRNTLIYAKLLVLRWLARLRIASNRCDESILLKPVASFDFTRFKVSS